MSARAQCADSLCGVYRIVSSCCAQLAALQVQAEFGPGLDLEDPEAFNAALERFVTRQVLMTRPKEEWRADVAARYACCLAEVATHRDRVSGSQGCRPMHDGKQLAL
jgi:hypothetical protein